MVAPCASLGRTPMPWETHTSFLGVRLSFSRLRRDAMLRSALGRRINRVLEPLPCTGLGFDVFQFRLLWRLLCQSTLSQNFLAAIGAVASAWGDLENTLKLSASALGSQNTDGWPTDDLEIAFSKLRKFWLREFRAAVPHLESETNILNETLVGLSDERNLVVHSSWHKTTTRGLYSRKIVHQRDKLGFRLGKFRARDLLALRDRIVAAHDDLRNLAC